MVLSHLPECSVNMAELVINKSTGRFAFTAWVWRSHLIELMCFVLFCFLRINISSVFTEISALYTVTHDATHL